MRKFYRNWKFLIFLLFFIFGVFFFPNSYAIFQKQIEGGKVDVRVGDFSYRLESEKLENNRITLAPNSSEVFDIKLTSLNSIDSRYELFYKIVSPEQFENEIDGGYLYHSENVPSGIIGQGESKDFKLVLNNMGNSEIIIEISIKSGFLHNELVLEDFEFSLSKELVQKFYVFDYTGNPQKFNVPATGNYKIDLWGASAGESGSYVSGKIQLSEGEFLYVYVGQKGDRGGTEIYNNGTTSLFVNNFHRVVSGSGATDVRLVGGNYNDSLSLRSRIMVASGSGGEPNYGGAGGGLVGYSGMADREGNPGGGGTQISGGNSFNNLTDSGFGIPAQSNATNSTDVAGSGGNGYYGGGAGYHHELVAGGGGGSSFISGHAGCIAIVSETNQSPKVATYSKIEDSYHYSGKIFTDTVMIDGKGYCWTTEISDKIDMPTHDFLSKMIGNAGNGYARITYLGDL